jgi:hypothetical protein
MSSTFSLHPVTKIIIIICFIPMACRVRGMTSVGDHGTIFEDG